MGLAHTLRTRRLDTIERLRLVMRAAVLNALKITPLYGHARLFEELRRELEALKRDANRS